jgi:threonylcarbamoyladenosine tRNA methylthiotransferase MtaB
LFYKNQASLNTDNKYKDKRIAFFTLGCKLNFAETSMISQKFIDSGYKKVSFDSDADVYLINTCSVTQVADKKCRNAIKKATAKGAKVVVVGCYSQLKPDEIAAIEGVDLVLGTNDKFKVVEHVEDLFNGNTNKVFSCSIDSVTDFDASFSTSDRTRAFLKVQDGCDYTCSYCTIPMARGKSRNENVQLTVAKAEIIASKGIKEIVLTGVNIGDFGKSTGENFFDLVRELDKVNGIERYRISSIEPNLITDEIIEFTVQSNKFMPHFHIPLQSGCDKILALMSRRYKREVFANRVAKIKSIIPNACIGADVIVGFPGETDDDFEDTFNFIKGLKVSYLHVFPYSERPNTRSVSMTGKVLPSAKDRRSQLLIELSEQKRKLFYEENLGNADKVIFESRVLNGKMFGFTQNYIKTEAEADNTLFGQVANVQLLHVNNSNNVDVKIFKC